MIENTASIDAFDNRPSATVPSSPDISRSPAAQALPASFDAELSFASDVLPPNSRWSTWPSRMPTERGPEPRPDWIETSADAIDRELGVLKSGKEADVFLIRRGLPDAPGTVLAAKRYRRPDRRDFHRSAIYTEGRKTAAKSRERRAMERGSSFGREVAATEWSLAEFRALADMYSRGLPVPYPVQVDGTEVLMQFIGMPDGTAAPRLAQSHAHGPELAILFDQVREILHLFAEAGRAHGDLSPYNLLVDDGGRVVVIDLPQLVDLAFNPLGFDLLQRDCVNVCTWFTRRGLAVDGDTLFADVLSSVR